MKTIRVSYSFRNPKYGDSNQDDAGFVPVLPQKFLLQWMDLNQEILFM